MKIAVDAMGGDHAPEAVVAGALQAAPQCPADFFLIGPETRLHQILDDSDQVANLKVIHSPDAVSMEEAGSVAIRKKRDASLPLAMRMLAAGEFDAVVSAGNSAAMVATAKHFVGMAAGLRRPALIVPIPTPQGTLFLVDAGAHAQSDTIHLVQCAVLAHAYLQAVLGNEHPRVGLLNIGREPAKGPQGLQRAYGLLERSSLNFVGNIEPQDFFADCTDVVVCDGFVGNIVLKLYEGLTENFLQVLETQLQRNGPPETTENNLWQTFRGLEKIYHYQYWGGAPLLGVKKIVVMAHGRSQGTAIASAMRLACHLVQTKSSDRMAACLEQDSLLTEFNQYSALWSMEHWKSKWGFIKK